MAAVNRPDVVPCCFTAFSTMLKHIPYVKNEVAEITNLKETHLKNKDKLILKGHKNHDH